MSKKFYNSSTWKRIRRVKLGQNPVCEICERNPASNVDHIKAINNGGDPVDSDNLQSLCHSCHSRKTIYVERLGYDHAPVRGCDVDGTPLDKDHWWNKENGQNRAET